MIPLDTANHAEAKRIAALYGIEIETLVLVGGGFSGACIFRVKDTSRAVFALRRTPAADAMEADRYCELVSLLRDVRGRGCGVVPVPLRHQQSLRGLLGTAHPSVCENVDLSQTRLRTQEFVWQMEPWMPGEPAHGPPSSQQLESTLEALELFHKFAVESVQARVNSHRLRIATEHSPGILRRIEIATELSNGLLARFLKAAASEPDPEFCSCAKRLCAALEYWLPWLTKQLTEVAHVSYRLQPVIRDLWRPHVLFTEDRVTGIIDLNAMATDHVGLDATRLFRSWYGADVDRIREAINLFCVRRSLDATERRLLAVYDASTVLLSPVTWLRRRFTNANSASIAQEGVQRVAELTTLAERFEPL
ncbi:MAG: phosphotransferase [Planctomycetaceae bacterium]